MKRHAQIKVKVATQDKVRKIAKATRRPMSTVIEILVDEFLATGKSDPLPRTQMTAAA